MGREELRAALEELTASLAPEDVEVDRDAEADHDPSPDSSSEEQLARLALLEELRGL